MDPVAFPFIAFLITLLLLLLVLVFRWYSQIRRPPEPVIERGSFVAGQFIVVAKYEPVLATNDPQQVIKDVQRLLPRPQDSAETRFPPEQVFFFSGPDERGAPVTYATVLGVAPGLARDSRMLVAYVDTINRQIEQSGNRRPVPSSYQRQGPPRSAEGKRPGDADLLGALLGAPSVTPAAEPTSEPRLMAASVNWLSSGAPQGGGVGGPGGRPVPLFYPGTTTQQTDVDTTHPWRITLPFDEAKLPPTGERPVYVAILDTIPAIDTLPDAYRGNDGTPRNVLLRSLFEPDGVFDIGPGARLEIVPCPPALLEPDAITIDHDYPMPDHGLFVAGSIHAIEPSARLRLVQVLNNFGVGTLQSILWGLQQVVEWRADKAVGEATLIVNCSLMLNSPAPNQALIDLQAERDPDLRGVSAASIAAMSNLLGDITAVLTRLTNAEGRRNAVVVASAGNDGGRSNWPPHPDARYPAAYDHVVGVGALRNQTDPASYSNLSDNPEAVGIATFGGGVDSSGYAHWAEGMIGLYLSPLPGVGVPENGLARWAGTSFAAPVISGAFAWLFHRDAGIDAADPLSLLRAVPPNPQNSGIGEVFSVRQG